MSTDRRPSISDPSAVGTMLRHRYGWTSLGAGDLLASLRRPRTTKPPVVAPGTPRSIDSPATRFARLSEPFSLHPPQISGNVVHLVVEGPFWTAVAVAASEEAERAGVGLSIQVGVGDKISTEEGSFVSTTYRFFEPVW